MIESLGSTILTLGEDSFFFSGTLGVSKLFLGSTGIA